jgi:ABC-type phosphate transport system permease subunit
MNYAEIEAINRETAEMTKRITLKWDIISVIMIIVCTILIVLAIRMIWEGWRERKERKAQEVYCGNEFQPVVTDIVQYDQFGTEFRRMGVAGRR